MDRIDREARAWAQTAARQVGRVAGSVHTMLEERGVLDVVRRHPLASVLGAFALGLWLGGRGRRGGGVWGELVDELKGAVLGAASAALARELGLWLGHGTLAETDDDEEDEAEGYAARPTRDAPAYG